MLWNVSQWMGAFVGGALLIGFKFLEILDSQLAGEFTAKICTIGR